MIRLSILLLFLATIARPVFADENKFIWPVKHDISISGNFCELRKNHFHAGIDIRSSNGQSGDSLFCIGNGKVSRVRVQRGSYGQVMYIDHPNGLTSVYAHLHEFHPKVEALLKTYQYAIEETEIDLYLDSTTIEFKQGEYIGKMGNTGRSTGPHLHFEIRDTETEDALNPFNFGFNVEDTKPPVISKFWIHELDSAGTYLSRQEFNHTLDRIDIHSSAAYLGLAVLPRDKLNSHWGNKMINKMGFTHSDSITCEITFDRMSFAQSRDINALHDYELYKSRSLKNAKLYKMPFSDLKLYDRCSNYGMIPLDSFTKNDLTLYIEDYNGNRASQDIRINKTDTEKNELKEKRVNNKDTLLYNNLKVIIGSNSLFEPAQISLTQSGNTYTIGTNTIPLNDPIKLEISNLDYRPNYSLLQSGTSKSFGGTTSPEGTFSCSIDELGTFELKEDTSPPSIVTVNFNKTNRSPNHTWKFSVEDNYIDESLYNKMTIKADIDGVFIRSYYDSKTKTLSILDLERIPQNAQQLNIHAIDILGNSKTKTYSLN